MTARPTRESRAARVADQIENTIFASRLPVGAFLGRRTDLIERHAVSPSVMNEVLRLLDDRGLITAKPGPQGGVFVASELPQVRLGAFDLWFRGLTVEPLKLFESRAYLENLLAEVALSRATPADIAEMDRALDELRCAESPRVFFPATMRLHLVIGRASRLDLLVNLHESIVAILDGALARVDVIYTWERVRRQSLEVHGNLVQAIRDRDREVFAKVLRLHDQDLIRDNDPDRSPRVAVD